MTKLNIKWKGDCKGIMLVDEPTNKEIRNISELTNYITGNYSLFSDNLLEALGAISLFMSIREFGTGSAGHVIQGAERALDSFYLVLPDQERSKCIDVGVEAIKEYLYPFRNESYEVILRKAWDYLVEEFGRELGFGDGSQIG
jgi:hypothetical protein